MKGVEATPEEQERLATGNNNGSLDCKHAGSRPLSTIGQNSIFHSVTFFMIVFLSGWVLQGMFLTYLVSVMTTIEKLFNVESKTTGTLLSATEVGQICTALFLTYLAGRGHRPRWIAYMMLVLSVGVIGVVIPHLLYGTQLLDVHLDGHTEGAAPVCYTSLNSSSLCDDSHIKNRDTRSNITAVVIPFLYCCLLVVGVGSTGICTLGMPYVDDNIGSTQSPLYVAITMSTRVIGPALGFLLGALCTRVYVDPFLDPGFDASDPRWVGAWWLGLLFISTFILLLAILMFGFPRTIKEEYPMVKRPRESFCKDFYISMKRLVTNDILMLRTASSVLHLVPISGIYSFLPKYLEKQFRLPSHEANLVSGLGGILVMGIGSMMSGTILLKLLPRAKTVAAWTATTAAVYVIGMIILMFVSCPEQNYRMISDGNMNGIANTHLTCSSGCNCTDVPFNPVCGQDSFTYLSPCQAGCLESYQLDNHTWLYSDCSCINSTMFGDKALDAIDRYQLYNTSTGAKLPPNKSFAVSGECEGTCNQIYTFVAIFATMMFVHATGEVGSMLIVMRCTGKEDKAMAMGVIQFGIGLFGNVPCPIVFGAAVDAACRARDLLCDVFGTCVSYDIDSFRHYYLGLAASMMFLGFIMDLLVWSKADQIDLHPDEQKKQNGEGNPEESNPDESNPDDCNPDAQKAPLHPALLGPIAPPVDTQL